MSQNDEEGMEYDLFNDPALTAAYDALSPEEKEKYRRQGEHYFANDLSEIGLDENGEQIDFIMEAAAELTLAMRSGLHPNDLTDDERHVIREAYGTRWWTKFGYTDDEVQLDELEQEDQTEKKRTKSKQVIKHPNWARSKAKPQAKPPIKSNATASASTAE